MKLVSVAEMKRIEADADARGYSYEKMMLKAGNELAKLVHKRYFNETQHAVIGLVGPGNNGGDTLVALSALKTLGWETIAVLFRARPETDLVLQQYHELGGESFLVEEKNAEKRLEKALLSSSVILDGVLGTGFHLPLAQNFAHILALIQRNVADQAVVVVDCPSGCDCESGECASETLHADLTVCMEAVKNGLVKLPAFLHCGDLVTVDLGIPKSAKSEPESLHEVVDESLVRDLLPIRPRDSHKGTFGTVMVVGGSINYSGAPALAGKAAYAVGTGLVRMAVPDPLHAVLAGNFLEAVWLLLEDEMGVIAEPAAQVVMENLNGISCLLVGPGIGQEETTQRFVYRLLFNEPSWSMPMGFISEKPVQSQKETEIPPLVIDADALRIIARKPDWYKMLAGRAILTPHPGEMSALTGLTIEEIQQDRQGVACRYAELWGHVVVLKGALTVVADPSGRSRVIPVASSSLAKAGSGDVLAGVIASLAAQKCSLFDAASAGAWLHARAGILAAKDKGSEASILASDLIQALPKIIL